MKMTPYHDEEGMISNKEATGCLFIMICSIAAAIVSLGAGIHFIIKMLVQ